MKRHCVALFIGVVVLLTPTPFILTADSKMQDHSESAPVNGFVPDEKTAIEIARAVLRPLFGEERIKNAKQFYATLHDKKIWVVEDAPPSRRRWANPIVTAQIDRERGCILKVSGE